MVRGGTSRNRPVLRDGTISATGKLRWEKQCKGVYNPFAGGATPLSRLAGWKTASDVSARTLDGSLLAGRRDRRCRTARS